MRYENKTEEFVWNLINRAEERQSLEDLSNEQKAEQHEDERFAERAERDAELEKFN